MTLSAVEFFGSQDIEMFGGRLSQAGSRECVNYFTTTMLLINSFTNFCGLSIFLLVCFNKQ